MLCDLLDQLLVLTYELFKLCRECLYLLSTLRQFGVDLFVLGSEPIAFFPLFANFLAKLQSLLIKLPLNLPDFVLIFTDFQVKLFHLRVFLYDLSLQNE